MEPRETAMGWIGGTESYHLEVPYLLRIPDGDAAPGTVPLVVVLHGMGMSCESFARRLDPLINEPWGLLIPQGPYPFEIRHKDPIRIGYSWYMYRGDEAEWLDYLVKTESYINRLVEKVMDHFPVLDQIRTFLVGYSQGGYLGYFIALRNPVRYRGYAAINGRLKERFLKSELEATSELRFLVLHGERDSSVPIEGAERSLRVLREHGFPTDYEARGTSHELHAWQVESLRDWIARQVS